MSNNSHLRTYTGGSATTPTLGPVPLDDGFLRLYLGPMFACKTSRLVMELTRMADLGFRTLYVNYSGDNRTTAGGDPNVFSSHNSTLSRISGRIVCVRVESLSEVDVTPYQVVGVDEANFYPDLVPVVLDWVDRQHLQVYVSGLDGDCRRRPFGHVLELLPHADQYEKITSQCTLCLGELRSRGYTGSSVGLKAAFTARTVSSEETILIGGGDCYLSVCRRHHGEAGRN